MTSPATPMNDAAERYSPLIAEAFHPTLTEREATKKSDAVREKRVAQMPRPIATTKQSGTISTPVMRTWPGQNSVYRLLTTKTQRHQEKNMFFLVSLCLGG